MRYRCAARLIYYVIGAKAKFLVESLKELWAGSALKVIKNCFVIFPFQNVDSKTLFEKIIKLNMAWKASYKGMINEGIGKK